jgi:predicted NAD-dependent protein-ADP-ribosyltransferase YbiA (DUF1768 family)
MRDDCSWGAVRFDVMVDLLRLKFRIPLYKDAQLSTDDAELIEDAALWNDTIWGVGRSGTGQNLLGKGLMKFRDELRN